MEISEIDYVSCVPLDMSLLSANSNLSFWHIAFSNDQWRGKMRTIRIQSNIFMITVVTFPPSFLNIALMAAINFLFLIMQ